MYRGVGDDQMIFIPGSVRPRTPIFQVHETSTPAPAVAPKPIHVVPETTPKPVLPALPGSELPPAEAPEQASMLPVYLAVGGVAVIGVAWLLFRK